jgi:hypothetical protein
LSFLFFSVTRYETCPCPSSDSSVGVYAGGPKPVLAVPAWAQPVPALPDWGPELRALPNPTTGANSASSKGLTGEHISIIVGSVCALLGALLTAVVALYKLKLKHEARAGIAAAAAAGDMVPTAPPSPPTPTSSLITFEQE